MIILMTLVIAFIAIIGFGWDPLGDDWWLFFLFLLLVALVKSQLIEDTKRYPRQKKMPLQIDSRLLRR